MYDLTRGKVSIKEWENHLLRYYDGRFLDDSLFGLFLYNTHGGRDDSILSMKLIRTRNLFFLAMVVMARICIFHKIVRDSKFLRLS
jgi:hypothetical protein